MRPERVAELLSKLKYKPGWSFEMRALPGELHVRVEAKVPDSDGSRDLITLYAGNTLSLARVDLFDEFKLWTLVEALIRQIEDHEIREWLRIDGEPVIDPHPKYESHSRRHAANTHRYASDVQRSGLHGAD